MIRWRFHDTGAFGELLEELLRESAHRRESPRGQPMPLNAYDEGSELVVEALLPGVRPEDVDLGCSDGVLTIAARLEVPDRDFEHQEVHTTQFYRQLALPPDSRFEDASASSENGVLTIRIPKRRPHPPERIRIEVARKPTAEAAIEAKPGTDYEEVKRPRRAPRKKPSGSGPA